MLAAFDEQQVAAAVDHVGMLHAMFPDVEADTISMVLESTSGDPEAAVEALLSMCQVGGASSELSAAGELLTHQTDAGEQPGSFRHPHAGPGSFRHPHADERGPRARDHQIADDEALARQLQQQLAFEDQLLEHQQQQSLLEQEQQFQHSGGANWPHYPGTANVPVPRPRWTAGRGDVGPPPANPADDEPGIVSSVGSAVYSAGAATVGGATSLVSGLWSWATADAEAAAPEAVERELQPMRSRVPGAAGGGGGDDGEETVRVINSGGADHTESGGAGEMRRRTRRAGAAED